MFQSILKRDDRQFQEDLSSLPPGYGDDKFITDSSLPPSLPCLVLYLRYHLRVQEIIL